MATVHLPSGLTQFTGGVAMVEVDALRVVDVLKSLVRTFPDLESQLDQIAVAIDGEIYQEPGYQPVRPASDVYLVPRIAGG